MTKIEFLEHTLPYVSKASRYLGNEINAVRKDRSEVDITFALAFPDVYEVGMSHMGLHILYNIMNTRKNIACERAFAPWPDMEACMQAGNMPLATLESCIPLRDCDIVGFSLEYELAYATVLRMLSLADIPLRAEDRDESFPLILGGGPSTYNPEPVATFFDAFVIGDGEEVIIEVCDTVCTCRRNGATKQQVLEALSEIPGIYVPSFFQVDYNPDGTISEIKALKEDYSHVTKRTVSNFSDVPFCTAPIVPFMQIIHDRAGIEIARGCSKGCRFCMAGMIYRPVREKDMTTIRQLTKEALHNTGYEELALASLSSGDYTGIQNLLQALMHDHRNTKTAVSFPSLRAETLTRSLMEEIKKVRKTGFTIAPEAGTQRLRDVINKGLTEDTILATASQVFEAGWKLIKLYFMIGLPTETMDDLDGVIRLSKRVASVDRRKQLNVSVSTFVPKPHTPFQWEAQNGQDEIIEKQFYLRDRLQSKKLRFKWHDPQLSILEGVFSRGDRRLDQVLVKAHSLGAGFEAWSDLFKPDLWNRAFEECGVDKAFYLRKRDLEECLPWSHISAGLDEAFLKKELRNAYDCINTPDCRSTACGACGVCNGGDRKPEFNTSNVPEETSPSSALADKKQAETFRYRLCYTKTDLARFLSHLELSTCFARAMRRASLPLKYTQGFHPHPRIVFFAALPVGMESLQEYCDVELTKTCAPETLLNTLNRHMPEGVKIISCRQISLKNNPLLDTIRKYRLTFPTHTDAAFPSADELESLLENYNTGDTCIVASVKKGSTFTTDIKPLIASIALVEPDTVDISLNPATGKVPKITDIAAHIFHLDDKARLALRILKLQ